MNRQSIIVQAMPPEMDLHGLLRSSLAFVNSFGLRPVQILPLSDIGLKKKAFGFLRATQKSARATSLVFIGICKEITKERIASFISEIARAKKVSPDSLYSYKRLLESTINSPDPQGKKWQEKQAASTLDILHHSAEVLGMEIQLLDIAGRDQLDALLGLSSQGFTTYAAVLVYDKGQKRQPVSGAKFSVVGEAETC